MSSSLYTMRQYPKIRENSAKKILWYKSVSIYGNFKYLGIPGTDNILHTKVRDLTQKEYMKRLQKNLKMKLNDGNTSHKYMGSSSG